MKSMTTSEQINSTEFPRATKRAIIKWNNGRGALLCNNCNTIIKEGFDFEDKEYYCDKHTNLDTRHLPNGRKPGELADE